MLEESILIPTASGSVDTFLCRPDRPGPFPGVIVYMDAPAIREELRDFCRRIATVGYAVLLPNLYYRHGHGITLGADATVHGSKERERMTALMNSITHAQIEADTRDLLAFIDTRADIKPRPLGCVGYCMSGPFVTVAGAAFPDRFAAIMSMFGVAVASDRPDSAHLRVGAIRGEAYFGFGSDDELTPAAEIDRLRRALAAAGTRHTLEMYPGVGHAFAFPSRTARYHKPSAERHWERMFDLLRRNLGVG